MPASIGPVHRPYVPDYSAATPAAAPASSASTANFSVASAGIADADPAQNSQMTQELLNLGVNIFQNGQSQCAEALDKLNKPDDDEDEESDDPDDAL